MKAQWGRAVGLDSREFTNVTPPQMARVMVMIQSRCLSEAVSCCCDKIPEGE